MTGDEYARAVGERLRAVRLAKGMSLNDVHETSGGTWKAAVVGAYERGDRNVTIARLADLAGFYGVTVSEIIPEEEAVAAAPGGRDEDPERMLTIREADLVPLALLQQVSAPELLRRLGEWGLLPDGD